MRIVECALIYDGIWYLNLEYENHENQDPRNVDCARTVYLDLKWDCIIPNPNPD